MHISPLYIRATLPGCGKTTLAKNLVEKTLIVTSFNALSQELGKTGVDTMTIDKLFGLVPGVINHANTNKYDLSNYDCVCFDEVGIYNYKALTNIQRFISANPKLKIIATGDTDQNVPFGYKLNNHEDDMKNYLKSCLDQIFPNQITLKLNKRLRDTDEQSTLNNLKEDIFNYSLDIIDVFKKYNFNIISTLSDVNTLKNISYFNFRSEIINKHIESKLIQPIDDTQLYVLNDNGDKEVKMYFKHKDQIFYKGMKLLCKQHYKNKFITLHVNYKYILHD